MTNSLVGAVPDDNLGIVEEVIRRLRKEEGFAEKQKLFLAGKYQLIEGVEIKSRPFAKLEKMLSRRFVRKITVDSYPKEFTSEFLANAARLNMRPVFFTDEDISKNSQFKKWTKSEKWFYDRVSDGKIKPLYPELLPTMLRRGWYLADFTVGVDYTDGSQVFVDDPLAPIIAKLREHKLIGKYDNTPIGSRFAITSNEWQNVVFISIASALGVTRDQIRFERAIEFNTIGNLYDFNRGKFNMWEWFADVFGDSNHLCGGRRGSGGLANVYSYWSGNRIDSIAGRPLVSFVK